MLVRLAILIGSLLISTYSFSQGEFVAGYGVFSSSELGGDSFRPPMENVTTLKGDYNTHTTGLGPWVVGFSYHLSNDFSLGIVGVVNTFTTSYFGSTSIDGVDLDARQRVSASQLSSLARLHYSWFHVRNLSLYSSVSVGMSYGRFSNSSEKIHKERFTPAYQANFLGVRVGGRFGAFFELGYGYAGVASVGISLYLK